MRNAYALLGLAFILVFGCAYILFERVHAPTPEDVLTESLADNNISYSMSLTLSSSVFEHNMKIPSSYTCDGVNINPALTIDGVPEGTKSLVLVMDDPDIPEEIKSLRGISKFNHWALYNMPPDTVEIAEGVEVGIGALNSTGSSGYYGPCPPTQYEPTEHRYIFRLYALPDLLHFEHTPTLDEVEAAAQDMALDRTELIGRYSRVKGE